MFTTDNANRHYSPIPILVRRQRQQLLSAPALSTNEDDGSFHSADTTPCVIDNDSDHSNLTMATTTDPDHRYPTTTTQLPAVMTMGMP